ncbi:dullard-like phosphatase domain-containing protein [Allomyces macrogynus ATCC 38327]|uniref:Dullard-like phosphatase domain-containing protein n=1 Tax=Allomyces macrogynus (strain ATCC 38327) TaxID=578462 RepID=A0A0L0S1P0_ALLM3|nr:dullard-like phosphatase domain-containing protein [Allomyces macrogynus ATCC 38327]|eukprot:KNE56335.1 dullard-like phosphatase domain-containing protein [Allomyces macrogynus ATCC 38327]
MDVDAAMGCPVVPAPPAAASAAPPASTPAFITSVQTAAHADAASAPPLPAAPDSLDALLDLEDPDADTALPSFDLPDADLVDDDAVDFICTVPPLPRSARGRGPLLPLRPPGKSHTLLLDIDETLLMCRAGAMPGMHLAFSVEYLGTRHDIAGKLRPGVRAFLRRMSRHFELVLFTASQAVYADRVRAVLDPHGDLIDHLLHRDHCVPVNGNYLKDLAPLGRDLATTLLVDNAPQAFAYHPLNGIPVPSWYGDLDDRVLPRLARRLVHLAQHPDVRPLICAQSRLVHRLVHHAHQAGRVPVGLAMGLANLYPHAVQPVNPAALNADALAPAPSLAASSWPGVSGMLPFFSMSNARYMETWDEPEVRLLPLDTAAYECLAWPVPSIDEPVPWSASMEASLDPFFGLHDHASEHHHHHHHHGNDVEGEDDMHPDAHAHGFDSGKQDGMLQDVAMVPVAFEDQDMLDLLDTNDTVVDHNGVLTTTLGGPLTLDPAVLDLNSASPQPTPPLEYDDHHHHHHGFLGLAATPASSELDFTGITVSRRSTWDAATAAMHLPGPPPLLPLPNVHLELSLARAIEKIADRNASGTLASTAPSSVASPASLSNPSSVPPSPTSSRRAPRPNPLSPAAVAAPPTNSQLTPVTPSSAPVAPFPTPTTPDFDETAWTVTLEDVLADAARLAPRAAVSSSSSSLAAALGPAPRPAPPPVPPAPHRPPVARTNAAPAHLGPPPNPSRLSRSPPASSICVAGADPMRGAATAAEPTVVPLVSVTAAE